MLSKIKKGFIFLVFLPLISCVSLLKDSPEEYQKKYKKVLILPLYVNLNAIPSIPGSKAEDFFLSNTEFNIFIKKFEPAPGIINNLVKAAMENGRFHHEVIIAEEKITSLYPDIILKKTKPTDPEINAEINYTVELRKNAFQDLFKKYNVDAIYFHAIEHKVGKRRYSFGRSYLVLPGEVLNYKGQMINNLGEIIYNSKEYIDTLISFHTYKSVGGRSYQAKKVNIENIKIDKDRIADDIGWSKYSKGQTLGDLCDESRSCSGIKQ